MSRIANLLTLSLIAALALAWGWALTTAFAGESNPDTAGSNRAWSVQGQSDAPHTFIGKVTINGIPPAVGSTVTAWDGSAIIGSTTTTDGGNFHLEADRSSGSVSFQVNGITANKTHSYVPDERTSYFTLAATDSNFLESAGVTSNPSQVLANQRVTLSGNGFKAGTSIRAISVGGKIISSSRINNGGTVSVDDSGRWSATVDLPLHIATIGEGQVAIQATDSNGAYGVGETVIPPLRITIDPPTGRVGTTATVRGTGFPCTNDEGEFSIPITYTDTSTNPAYHVSAVTDASGRFEAEIRIPIWATIPSTNTVTAKFNITEVHHYADYVLDLVAVNTTATTPHSVPPASIGLSAVSGAPGTEVTVKVEGAMAFVPVRSVFIGNTDITPSPWPATNARGITEFNIRIPNLPPGSFPIEVRVADSTSRETFTVTAASIALSPASGAPGTDVTISGEGFESFMPVTRVLVGDVDVTLYPSARTDAQGSVLFDIRIPNLAPGSFPVEVQTADATARATFTVTPASVALSPTSSAPGTEVLVKVEGANVTVPVRVLVGGFDVTTSPAPYTTRRGIAEFYILIPNLQPGTFPVEVTAGRSNARATFTVTAATTPTPAATPAPAAPQLIIPGNEPPHLFIGRATLNGNAAGAGVSVQAYDGGKLIGATVTQAGGTFTIHVHRSAGVITFRVNNQAAAESWASWSSGQANHGFNLTAGGSRVEDNPSRLFAALPDLVRAFTFDNATKGWNFFDPLAADVSTLTRFMPQHSYWLLVSRTTWLMLNGVERQLTCVEGNCWNLIVW